MRGQAIRIIGIDPGLRRTGWGIIQVSGSRLAHVADGVVRVPEDLPLAGRLLVLLQRLEEVLRAHAPDEAAVEETFVNKDARATLKLGQARGVALLVPAAAGLAVAEYAPNTVKKSVVGVGHADKAQIRHMVQVLLPRCRPESEDAADALAVAITHAHHRNGNGPVSTRSAGGPPPGRLPRPTSRLQGQVNRPGGGPRVSRP